MDQRILFIAIFLLNFLFLILFSQKFLPLLSASLTNLNSSDFASKLQEISQKLDKISQEIENLNSKLENTKIDLSPISKEISSLKNQIQKKSEIAFKGTEETESEIEEKATETEKTEIKKEPKISLSFPKEVSPNQEFEVLFSAENFEQKNYDVKISVEYNGEILSKIFDKSKNDWQSSKNYLNNVFIGPSFSGTFKLKIISENIFGDVQIIAKVKETGTTNPIATTSEKIKIKQTSQEITQTQPQTPPPSTETQKECIDINTASKEELMKIKWVGEKIADLIIQERQKRPFSSLDELETRISGIGPKKLQDIKQQGLACVK